RWLWMQAILPGTIHNSRPNLCHFTNALAPLWQPAPFVLTIHDASLFVYAHYHPWARHLTMRLTLPIVARRAAAIITVSEHSREDLIRVLDLDPQKIHVVYEAAAKMFQPVEDEDALWGVRSKYGLPEEFVLYVGTLEPRKNLVRLLKAMRQIRDEGHQHHLVLAGAMGWMMESFLQEVYSLGLEDFVHYLGYIPAQDLPTLFSLASVFAFPSLYEGFGLPPLEAMACGTPVLTSNQSSLAEICGDAAYLVEPHSTESIATGLADLLGDEELRRSLRKRGLERVSQFSWRRAAHETSDVYRQVKKNGL
ncbi:MAG TPA: glycosyltransferase family 1 protein, partial [Candidatus Binatia bacterium]|nr:glycosyltransferase family 1 protein [Candidatus Binatia bacterium]